MNSLQANRLREPMRLRPKNPPRGEGLDPLLKNVPIFRQPKGKTKIYCVCNKIRITPPLAKLRRTEKTKMLILLIILILVFGFGGYRMGPGLGYYGGGGISLILTIVLILLLLKVI
jgi:hypothetical protein